MTHNLYVAVSKSASVCWYSELRKKVCVLQRASTEATWITAPEVSRKAVNINDSSHPHPPKGFFSQTVVLSALLLFLKESSKLQYTEAHTFIFF